MKQNHFGQTIGTELPDWQSAQQPQREILPGHFCYLAPVDADKHETSLYQAYHMVEDAHDWTYFYCERPENEDDFHQYLQTLINAKDASKRREELTLEAYGVPLERALKRIINYRLSKRKEVYILKEYLSDFKKEKEELAKLVDCGDLCKK